MNTRINKFGFEIEGEFYQDIINSLEEDGEIKTDGSIHRCPKHTDNFNLLEFASYPYKRTQKQKAKKIFEILHKAYKEKKFHFNKSMGFHIHISFKPILPFEIFSEEFVKFFNEELKKKYLSVFKRRGNNHFCMAENQSNEQIIEYRQYDERYRSVNLYPAFKRHKTIEIRIFPSDRPLKMYKYLLFSLRTIRKFLKQNKSFTKTFDQEWDEKKTLSKDWNFLTRIPLKEEVEYKF